MHETILDFKMNKQLPQIHLSQRRYSQRRSQLDQRFKSLHLQIGDIDISQTINRRQLGKKIFIEQGRSEERRVGKDWRMRGGRESYERRSGSRMQGTGTTE